MLPMLFERLLKFGQKLLGRSRGQSSRSKPFNQLLLANDMPLALNDVALDHLHIGSAVGHGQT